MRGEAKALARTAAHAVVANALPREKLPVALAGGVLTGSQAYREYFLDELLRLGVAALPVQLVVEPALGAIVLARR